MPDLVLTKDSEIAVPDLLAFSQSPTCIGQLRRMNVAVHETG